MPETSLPERIAPALSAAELRLDEVDVPLRARRREIAGRLALAAADVVAVTAALLIVSVLPVIEARFTAWILAFIPLFALLAKAAGLYDRDQVVLHKTTLDEAPVLRGRGGHLRPAGGGHAGAGLQRRLPPAARCGRC